MNNNEDSVKSKTGRKKIKRSATELEQMQKKRREQNKKAASKYRKREKRFKQDLQEMSQETQSNNTSLQYSYRVLNQESNKLESINNELKSQLDRLKITTNRGEFLKQSEDFKQCVLQNDSTIFDNSDCSIKAIDFINSIDFTGNLLPGTIKKAAINSGYMSQLAIDSLLFQAKNQSQQQGVQQHYSFLDRPATKETQKNKSKYEMGESEYCKEEKATIRRERNKIAAQRGRDKLQGKLVNLQKQHEDEKSRNCTLDEECETLKREKQNLEGILSKLQHNQSINEQEVQKIKEMFLYEKSVELKEDSKNILNAVNDIDIYSTYFDTLTAPHVIIESVIEIIEEEREKFQYTSTDRLSYPLDNKNGFDIRFFTDEEKGTKESERKKVKVRAEDDSSLRKSKRLCIS